MEFVSNKRTKKSRKIINKIEINIYQIEFKALVIRRLTELGETIDEHNEKFSKKNRQYKKEPIRVEDIVTKLSGI